MAMNPDIWISRTSVVCCLLTTLVHLSACGNGDAERHPGKAGEKQRVDAVVLESDHAFVSHPLAAQTSSAENGSLFHSVPAAQTGVGMVNPVHPDHPSRRTHAV